MSKSKKSTSKKSTYNTSMRVNYKDIPKIVREVLAVHEVLRKLGFESDDIFVAYCTNGIFVMLKDSKTGETKFTITCDEEIVKTVSQDEFHNMWIKYSNLWNGTSPGMSDVTRQKMFNESIIISEHGIEYLVLSMKAKGVDVPYLRQKCLTS